MKTLFITHCAVATICSTGQIHKTYADGMETESLSHTCRLMGNSNLDKHQITYSSGYKYGTYKWRSAANLQGNLNFNNHPQVSIKASIFSIPILLYPIPHQGGKFKLVMKDATATYEIIIKDAYGNIVRNYHGFRGSLLLTPGLKNGIYKVRIKNLSTGKIFTDTLIMKE